MQLHSMPMWMAPIDILKKWRVEMSFWTIWWRAEIRHRMGWASRAKWRTVGAAMWQAGLFDSSTHAPSLPVHVLGIGNVGKYHCHWSRTLETCVLFLMFLGRLCIFSMQKSFQSGCPLCAPSPHPRTVHMLIKISLHLCKYIHFKCELIQYYTNYRDSVCLLFGVTQCYYIVCIHIHIVCYYI